MDFSKIFGSIEYLFYVNKIVRHDFLKSRFTQFAQDSSCYQHQQFERVFYRSKFQNSQISLPLMKLITEKKISIPWCS